MSDERERAELFAAGFRAVYLAFHRRDGPRSQLAGASRAVLEHLAMAGPRSPNWPRTFRHSIADR